MAYVTPSQVFFFVFCLLFFLSIQIHVRLSICDCDAFTPVFVYFPYIIVSRFKINRIVVISFLHACANALLDPGSGGGGRDLHTKADVETDLLANEHEKELVDGVASSKFNVVTHLTLLRIKSSCYLCDL